MEPLSLLPVLAAKPPARRPLTTTFLFCLFFCTSENLWISFDERTQILTQVFCKSEMA